MVISSKIAVANKWHNKAHTEQSLLFDAYASNWVNLLLMDKV